MAGKLDHLKIKTAPACFSTWARNFNQQVDLLASMEGGPGIDVQIAHSPRPQFLQPLAGHSPREQPRGKIKFTVRPSALNGMGVGGNGSGNANINTVNVNVVGDIGLLYVLAVPNAAITTTYPNTIRAGNGATNYVAGDTTGFEIKGAANSVSIPFSNVARTMTIRTLPYNDNGNCRYIDVIASAPY